MKIGLDFDGVIANTPKLKSQFAKKLYHLEIDASHFALPYVTDAGLITSEQYTELQNFVSNNASVLPYLEPIHDALPHIHSLRDEGHYVSVVTARYGDALERAREWLKQHDVDIPITGVGLIKSKSRHVEGFDVFIDDALPNLYKLADTVPHRFLYSWGYNEIYKEDGVAIRVKNWKEFYNHIEKLSKNR